ncbi:MAG: hypothetical protein LBC73_09795 [Oscillospiraceae bacterium]|jgi:hypothetical protein|nr:hypothetical protein [Oscillospiraceae bacterium]
MITSKIKISPPTQEEIELVRQELCNKLENAENQLLNEKRNASIVFSEKREILEELLNARV